MKSSITLQHECFTADRWKVMLRVNGVAFQIGAECKTLKEAQDLRTAFKTALFELSVNIPQTPPDGAKSCGTAPDVCEWVYDWKATFYRTDRCGNLYKHQIKNGNCPSCGKPVSVKGGESE